MKVAEPKRDLRLRITIDRKGWVKMRRDNTLIMRERDVYIYTPRVQGPQFYNNTLIMRVLSIEIRVDAFSLYIHTHLSLSG